MFVISCLLWESLNKKKGKLLKMATDFMFCVLENGSEEEKKQHKLFEIFSKNSKIYRTLFDY